MAYYYVKSGGTATGDTGRYASQQTGAFSGLTAHYATVQLAFAATTPPAHGDFICISDAHSFTSSAAAISWATDNLGWNSAALPLTIMSVDDLNCENYKIATSVQETSDANNWDVIISSSSGDRIKLHIYGVWLKSGDDFITLGVSSHVFTDCTFEVAASGDGMNFYHSKFINCTFKSTALSNTMHRAIRYCDFYGGATTSENGMSYVFSSGESYVRMFDHDLSGSKISYLIQSNGGNTASTKQYFYRCRLPATGFLGYVNYIGYGSTNEVLVVNCGVTSAEAEYQYFYQQGEAHIVEDATNIYRDGSAAYPSGTQVSLKADTDAGCSHSGPFMFDLPTRYAELSSTATDTIRIHFLSSDSGLTSADVRISAHYADGTNKHHQNEVISSAHDPIDAGSALSTNTEAWTGRTTETRYYIDIDTSADVGADCVPALRVYMGKASTTIYFCPTVELS